jgi:hypothetical protein
MCQRQPILDYLPLRVQRLQHQSLFVLIVVGFEFRALFLLDSIT